MRFTCDSCSAKYSIADDRVKGRILKIRCKACNHIITVREEDGKSKATKLPTAPAIPADAAPRRVTATQQAIDAAFGPPPAQEEGDHTVVSGNPSLLIDNHLAATAAARAPAPVPADEWFVSFDGEQEGPLSLKAAIERVRTEHGKGRECFGWKAGFFVWLPIEEIPELREAGKKIAAPPPKPADKVNGAPVNGNATAAASAKTVLGAPAPVLPLSAQRAVTNGSEGDLPITEASALINLDHLRAAAMAKGAASSEPAVGPTASRAPSAAPATATGSPAPVVVVTGPAPRRTSGLLKLVAAAGVLLTLGLGGTLYWVISQRVQTGPTAPVADEKGKKVDDRTIAFADPTQPQNPGDPSKVAASAKRAVGAKPVPVPPTKGGPTPTASNLTADQKKLQALYGEDGDTTAPHGVPMLNKTEKKGGQVNQADILSVVTQNKRSLNMCYERVLKRDNTLERARVVTQVKVGMSGIVTKVTVPDPQYSDSEIGQCLTMAIKKWRFPSSDAEYETEFPILLQAE